MNTREALQVLLDQVDYTSGACSLTDMVGAALPKEVIKLCREAIKQEISDLQRARDDASRLRYPQEGS